MKKYKPTITIGIPAHNEMDNLPRLIQEILSQNMDNFVLERILVILDGNTDDTVKVLSKLKTSKLELINHKSRLGKPRRLNQLFVRSNSDIFIAIDADVYISSPNTIHELVKPFPKADYVSGLCEPFAPNTLVQKIAFAGVQTWTRARKMQKNLMYYSEGQFRAFSKNYYRVLRFPDSSADDVFPFIYAKLHGFKFKFCPRAIVNYKLPTSFSDYIKQQFRYLQSPAIQSTNFGDLIAKKFFTINILHRTIALLAEMVNNPFYTSLYLMLWVIAKVKVFINKPYFTSRWEILTSTK
jgi:glycosyltransferase involved in cell wall biosynthesis